MAISTWDFDAWVVMRSSSTLTRLKLTRIVPGTETWIRWVPSFARRTHSRSSTPRTARRGCASTTTGHAIRSQVPRRDGLRACRKSPIHGGLGCRSSRRSTSAAPSKSRCLLTGHRKLNLILFSFNRARKSTQSFCKEMKNTLARINNLSTSRHLTLWITIFVAACLTDGLSSYLWLSHGVHTPRVEVTSTILGWIGIVGLFILLPVSAFRPFNEFSMNGHCRQRAKLFGITLATNIMIFAGVVWMIGKAL